MATLSKTRSGIRTTRKQLAEGTVKLGDGMHRVYITLEKVDRLGADERFELQLSHTELFALVSDFVRFQVQDNYTPEMARGNLARLREAVNAQLKVE